jgi:hypothetical protein
MLYREKSPGVFVTWAGEPINEIRYPANIEQLWLKEDLAELGLFYEPVDPGVPEGKVSTGQSIALVNGTLTIVHTLENAPPPPEPPPPPPEPPPSFQDLQRPPFLFMMQKMGITETQVEGLISEMPEGDARDLALIVFKNQQTFKRDNTLLNTITEAAGLTSEQVDTAWRAAEQLTW